MYARPGKESATGSTRDAAIGAAAQSHMNLRHAEQWRKYAACVGMPSTMFVPETWNKTNVAAARTVCNTCPVRPACLDYALDNHEDFGMWGAMTPRQRDRYRQKRKAENELDPTPPISRPPQPAALVETATAPGSPRTRTGPRAAATPGLT